MTGFARAAHNGGVELEIEPDSGLYAHFKRAYGVMCVTRRVNGVVVVKEFYQPLPLGQPDAEIANLIQAMHRGDPHFEREADSLVRRSLADYRRENTRWWKPYAAHLWKFRKWLWGKIAG